MTTISEINRKIIQLENAKDRLQAVITSITWDNNSYLVSCSPISELQRSIETAIRNLLYLEYLEQKKENVH